MRIRLLLLLALLGFAGGAIGLGGAAPGHAAPAATLTWVPLWQPLGEMIWKTSANAQPEAIWPTHKETNYHVYRLCGDVQGYGEVTFVVGTQGDPVVVNSPAPYWEHLCLPVWLGSGGGGATIMAELYLRTYTRAPLYFRAPVIFVGIAP